MQRNLTNFEESSMVENQLIEHNCVNCHSFCQNDPDKFMLHVRGNKGGTYFVDGEKITKTNLKTKEMDFGAVYPYWHPGGRFVAYSSNKVVQNFYADPHKNIEVYDLASSLVIYDTEKNEMLPIGGNDSAQYLETFPTWSPDGKYIYFCVADQVSEGFDVEDVKYSLARRSFDAGLRSFGEMEMVYNAKVIGKSVSFPRISPNGKNLVFTLFDFGTFSIWHKEADLYNLDLTTKEASKMSVNSDETESYHSWSSNGRWLVFSSKRGDGLSARPYIAYVREDGTFGKPFIMPQKDPAFYDRMLKTYNVPEFVTGEIKIGPREIARTANDKPLNASWAGN